VSARGPGIRYLCTGSPSLLKWRESHRVDGGQCLPGPTRGKLRNQLVPLLADMFGEGFLRNLSLLGEACHVLSQLPESERETRQRVWGGTHTVTRERDASACLRRRSHCDQRKRDRERRVSVYEEPPGFPALAPVYSLYYHVTLPRQLPRQLPQLPRDGRCSPRHSPQL